MAFDRHGWKGIWAMLLCLPLGVWGAESRVLLQWDANPEPDVAGYRIYYGFRPGVYTEVHEAGLAINASVPLPFPGFVYYFAATAYNQAGLESGFSNEVSYRPPVAPDAPVVEQRTLRFTTKEDVGGQLWTFASTNTATPLWGMVRAPAHGDLAAAAAGLTYTPHRDFNGVDQCTVVLAESATGYELNVEIEVQPVADGPTAYDGEYVTSIDQPVRLWLVADDADGEPLAWTIVNEPSSGALSGTPPTLVYSPKAGWNGIDSFTFLVSDGSLTSRVATVRMQTLRLNHPPTATDSVVLILRDGRASFELQAVDADGDPLFYEVVRPPVHGILSGVPPQLEYAPELGFEGTDEVAFAVYDSQDDVAFGTVGLGVLRPELARPEILEVCGTSAGLRISWVSVQGERYRILQRRGLKAGDWVSTGLEIEADVAVSTYTIPWAAATAFGFYTVQWVAPPGFPVNLP